MIGPLALMLSLLATEPAAPLELRLPGWMSGGLAETVVEVAAPPPKPSLFAPPSPRNMTRVVTTWRPFLGFVGNTWGAIGDARIAFWIDRQGLPGLAQFDPVHA